MPYSHVTRTRNGAEAIQYCRGEGKGHNQNVERNQYVFGVNMLPDHVVPFEQQMQPFWIRADSRHKIQIDRFVISFSPDELDPENSEDILKAGAMLTEFAREYLSGHQVAVFIQTDGKGGKVHGHLAANDVHMETFKGMDSKCYAHFHLEKELDKFCEQYFDLAKREPLPEMESQHVRGLRRKNVEIKKANDEEIKAAKAEDRTPKLKPLAYIWQDDLRDRIKQAAAASTDESSFLKQLTLHGVEAEKKPATKKQPEHYTYVLTDTSKFPGAVPYNLKARSYKLGVNYQPEGVARLFKGVQTKAAMVQVQQAPTMQPVASGSRQKAPKEKSSQNNDAAMAVAKERAQIYVRPMFMESMGWRDLEPGEYDEEIMLAMPERDRAAAASWEKFERWRVEQRKAGRKLDNIYQKDNIGVNPIREAIVGQYHEFLTGRQAQYEPEPHKATQKPPELPQEPHQGSDIEAAPEAARRLEAHRRAQEEQTRANRAQISMAMEAAMAVGGSVTLKNKQLGDS